jgi:hypothetical protein
MSRALTTLHRRTPEASTRHELAILDAGGADRVRLAGWVRDDISDRIDELIHKTTVAKTRDRLAELARYYLRPIGSKPVTASRATRSNWRRDPAELLAADLVSPRAASLTFRLTGMPRKEGTPRPAAGPAMPAPSHHARTRVRAAARPANGTDRRPSARRLRHRSADAAGDVAEAGSREHLRPRAA